MVAGTPLYRESRGKYDGEVDRRSDIYSLGATFYTLLTGKAPYTGDAAPQIIGVQNMTAPDAGPSDLVPEIPDPVVNHKPCDGKVASGSLSDNRRDAANAGAYFGDGAASAGLSSWSSTSRRCS